MDPELLKSVFNLLQKKSSTTVCVFERNDYHMCFSGDAEFVASKILQSNAFIKKMNHDGKSIPYLTLNKNQYLRIIKELLISHQYRVELYRQTKGKSSVWDLIRKGSPGNLEAFEDILAQSKCSFDTNAVVALKLVTAGNTKHLAVACCDTTNQRFIVAEFPDNAHYNTLQTFLVQLGPKELLVPANERDSDYKAVMSVIRRFGTVTNKKQAEFNPGDVIQDLNKLVKFPDGAIPNALSLPETKMTGAMGCVAALIKYLNLLTDPASFNRYKLEKAAFEQFMRLDASVVRSLDLFELSGPAYNVKDTLYGLLNRCRTAPGKRLLDQWIKMPLLDVNKINERLDIVEAFTEESEYCQTLSNSMARFPDVQRISRKFLKNQATLTDLYKLFQAVRLIPNVINTIKKLPKGGEGSGVYHCLTEPLAGVQEDLSKLVELVIKTLDLENVKHFEVFIKPSYDPELEKLKVEMDRIEKKMQTEAERAAGALELELGKSVKLDSNPQLNFHLRVTHKDEKRLRGLKEIRVIDSNKAAVRFRTDRLTEHNDTHWTLKKNYEEVQENIAKRVLENAATFYDPLQRFCSIMAMLDVFLSLANVSRDYVRPTILEKGTGILDLKGARHPCLETHDNLCFIPNDVYFEKGKTEFLLITGPNMGGKSTYLRQTGLIVLMAQIGCFVPCASARISVVDAIFTRVGASDAQLEGASTFRLEMIEMASILETATCNSLILIDELGRGTSTYDGCALAWSIAEHIAKNIGCCCMFATHFHELTALDIDLPTVKNLHVTAEIHDGRFTLLYLVKEGSCGSSFGVHIAKVLNLPKSIIKDATRVLDEFAWSDNTGDENDGEEKERDTTDENSMDWESPTTTASTDRTLHDTSAASFVTEIHRIIKNDRVYATKEEKARALRDLLTKTTRSSSNSNGGSSATVPPCQ